GGIPIASGTVVEHAVAPHHQVIGISVGERRGDGHLFLAPLPGTVTVSKINATEGRQAAVLGHIVNPHAQVTSTTVEIQGPSLKDRRLSWSVEVTEGHEVIQQPKEVTMVANQFLDG